MVTGIVLIDVERFKIEKVIEALMAIDGVSEIYTVAGEYDLVAVIRVPDNGKLSSIIATKMTTINGIIHTKTLVTLAAAAKVDLESIFCKC